MATTEDGLKDWVEQTTSAGVRSLEQIPGGGSRTSYVVTLREGQRYLLRVDNGNGPLSGTEFTLGREYRILSALTAAGFAVPRIEAYAPEHDAMLMEYVDGKTSHQVQPPADVQRKIQRELLQKIVQLHGFDAAQLGLREFAALDTVGKAVARDLGTLRDLYRRLVTIPEPAIDFALHWLQQNVPDAGAPAVLVHGDMGPGNFLFDPTGRVLALIDWEVVHMGHPLEDLAAVLCRALGAAFGTAEQHIADYEEFTGRRVDRRSLDYFVILVLTRWFIGLNLALSRPATSQNIPILTTYRQSVAHTLICTLAKQFGLRPAVTPVLPAGSADTAFVNDYLIDALDTLILPATQDPFLVDRVKGLIKLSKYLRDLMAYGAERYAQEEQQAIEALLGRSCVSIDAARRELCGVAAGITMEQARPLVRVLLDASVRAHGVWRSAMGSMAERTLDY